MSLDQSSTFYGLKVCSKCGWAVISVDLASHSERCNADGGAMAAKLANSLPMIKSTKLGYGDGNLTFEFDDEASITLRCRNGSFAFESLYVLGDLDADAARDLVSALDAWRKRRRWPGQNTSDRSGSS